MAHPYDEEGFKHYLKFYDFDMDWYEICEPIGFDGAKYVKKQVSNRWARDIEYFAIEGLTFSNSFGNKLSEPRVYNPQGDTSDYLDYGLNYLLENRRIKGSEMKVGYKVQLNGVDFKEFELDNRGDDLTDGETYYKSKLIEVGLIADHFRNLKNTFNAFSDKNWKDETITPIQSFNYLVRPVPLKLTTIFNMNGNKSFGLSGSTAVGDENRYFYSGVNPSQEILEYGINDTLGWQSPADSNLSNFALISAQKTTTNLKITLDIDISYQFDRMNLGMTPGDGSLKLVLVKGSSVNPNIDLNPNRHIFFQRAIGNEPSESGTVTQVFNYEIDSLNVSEKIFIFFFAEVIGSRKISGTIRRSLMTINAIQTDLEIVCPAVRYIDLIKQGAKYVNDLPVLAPRFSRGGEFYNQAVFSKALLGNKKEMFTTNEDLQTSLQEYCADVEISTENMNIRQHQDFYENIEIGDFLVIPSDDYNEPYNETYLINNYYFGYKNYEQDRTVKDTSKSFHTYAEWLPSNERADKDKKIENNFIRDPFLKQSIFNLEIKSPTTSTEKDEKLFIEDMIELPPNSSGTFTRTLLMRWTGGRLEILNRNTLGTNEDSLLNWNNLGLSVGSRLSIGSLINNGEFLVYRINSAGSTITLTPINVTPDQLLVRLDGNFTIRVIYWYTNVQWQTRTRERFTGNTPSGYSNLYYTIKRNMKYWYYYLASATMYCKKDIKNSFFKNNGDLETQLESEDVGIIENATILHSDLPAPLVEPISIKAKIVANYENVVEYLETYKTVKGFVRIYTPNGKVVKIYPKNFEYTIATNEAVIDGEKKYEDEFLRIDITGNIVNVNDAPYDLSGVAEWYIVKNDYIQLYDKKSNPLSNFYKYDFVILNGSKFTSISELVTKLKLVQWT